MSGALHRADYLFRQFGAPDTPACAGEITRLSRIAAVEENPQQVRGVGKAREPPEAQLSVSPFARTVMSQTTDECPSMIVTLLISLPVLSTTEPLTVHGTFVGSSGWQSSATDQFLMEGVPQGAAFLAQRNL
jgi:hypothetical protein